jgi:thioredoxin-like negative regulator of GroEL
MKLIRYTAAWCQPCQSLKNSLSQLDLGELEVEVVDIDVLGREGLMKANVKGIPTLILQDDLGNELKRKTGAMTKEQLKLFLNLGD